MAPTRYPIENFASIHEDISKLLDDSRPASELLSATRENEENIIDVLLPSLSQRLCHLAAMTAEVEGAATASLMTCFSNDQKHLLKARVSAAFPVYGLDRYIFYRGAGTYTLVVYCTEHPIMSAKMKT